MSFLCHRFDQNCNENIVRISALKVFISSLALPENFLGFPVAFLINNDITQKVPKKPQKTSRKPPGSYKKNQGKNTYNILVVILVEVMTPKRHFKINWPLGCCSTSMMFWISRSDILQILKKKLRNAFVTYFRYMYLSVCCSTQKKYWISVL